MNTERRHTPKPARYEAWILTRWDVYLFDLTEPALRETAPRVIADPVQQPPSGITTMGVIADEATAKAEANRLNELNGDADKFYTVWPVKILSEPDEFREREV